MRPIFISKSKPRNLEFPSISYKLFKHGVNLTELYYFQVELARKRGWKGYWVCLKGTTLLFYPCDSREGRSVEATPKHLIIVDGAIMQVRVAL